MSLRVRLLAAFAYVLLLVIIAIEVPLALNLSRRVEDEVKANAAGQARLLAATAAAQLAERIELERVARRAARDVGGRVIIVDAAGRLIGDSAGRGLRGSRYGSRPEVARALLGETVQGTRHSASLDEDLLFTAVPIIRSDRPVGAVRVTQSFGEVRAEARRDMIALIGLGVVALALGVSAAWLVAGSLAGPMCELAETARRVAGGDLDANAEITGSTEQRDVAVAFNEMKTRLAHALAAQREFVANASHQLRTPLTGLRLRLEAARSKVGDSPAQRDLAEAEHETERLSKLLADLLTLVREEASPGTETSVELGSAATEAVERWRPAAEQADHRLAVAGDGSACVRASRGDIAMVLDNLIENAIKYSPSGTTVQVGWSHDGDWVSVAVLDEGPGLAPGEEHRVLERFYRGAASQGREPGTGLGLAIVETLVRRWGGRVRLSNRPEGGLRAEVLVPTERRTS